jgi:hypothetical protein
MRRRKIRVPSDYASLPRRRLVDLVTGLLADVRALEKENEELQRASKRQTAAFSKGPKKGKHKKPGRKKGKGRFSRRLPPTPDEITDRVTVPAPDVCPNCGDSDIELKWEEASNTDLPDPRPKVTVYRRAVCHCNNCNHHWRTPHPDLADNQYGATAHRFGPRLRAAAHVLHYRCSVPVRRVPMVLRELHGVKVTQSAITQDALRTAAKGPVRGRYEEIKHDIANAPIVHTDATGWRKAGKKAALITFATPETEKAAGQTLYHVRDHHGTDEVTEVLGDNFQGTLVTDRGPEYDANKLENWVKQKCNTHLKRNINAVLETKDGAARHFGDVLKGLLDEARALRRDYDAGKRKGYRAKVAELEELMDFHLRARKLTDPDNQRLLDGIGRQHDAGNVLRFLHDTSLSPDNHLAELQLRFAIDARKMSHCSKNDRGGESHGVHSTVYQTENRAAQCDGTNRGLIDRVVDLFRPRSNNGVDARPTGPP